MMPSENKTGAGQVLALRGVRGATTIEQDTATEVVDATLELLQKMVNRNQIQPEQIAAVIFTATSDICSEFPAVAARRMGWNLVPLLCFQEMEVKEAISRCIRVLMLVNTGLGQGDIRHVYLRRAASLRADLADKQSKKETHLLTIISSAFVGGSPLKAGGAMKQMSTDKP